MDDDESGLKYKRVEREIRRLIDQSGEGARLPSERKLADLLGISFMTVRKGLQVLVDEGSIERKAGSGTFVVERDRRNTLTTSNVKGQTTIGLIIFRESDSYAHKVLHALDEAALKRHVNLRFAWINDLGEGTRARIRKLQEEGVQALIYPWIPLTYASGKGLSKLRDLIESTTLPVILAPLIHGLEQYCFQSSTVYGSDLVTSTETLCAYFSILGHKRIALLMPDDTDNLLLQKRIVGYTYFTSRSGLEGLVSMIPLTDSEFDRTAESWSQFRGDLAVICYDDDYALRFMKSMARLGLYAPKDFCIIGFNDTAESRASEPPLTTILPNYAQSANLVLDSTEAALRGEVLQSRSRPSTLTFVVRESCGGREQVEHILKEIGTRLDIICED